MDHSEVRELLEDAAIDPGGLERLMAGDTAAASIVAGHLAGCADCAEELERLRRSVAVIGPTIRTAPPPELKARTMAYVAALGRPRGSASDESWVAAPMPAPIALPAPVAMPARLEPVAQDLRRRLGFLAGLAAALIVAVSGTALLVNVNHENAARTQSAKIDALGDVARWTLRVDAQPDVRRIQLASATGGSARGTLVYSPTSSELVVVADGLALPAAGREYRCWVEVGGARTGIGKMFFGGELAYWVGKVPQVAGLTPDARFGVSLVDLASIAAPGERILVSGG